MRTMSLEPLPEVAIIQHEPGEYELCDRLFSLS